MKKMNKFIKWLQRINSIYYGAVTNDHELFTDLLEQKFQGNNNKSVIALDNIN